MHARGGRGGGKKQKKKKITTMLTLYILPFRAAQMKENIHMHKKGKKKTH